MCGSLAQRPFFRTSLPRAVFIELMESATGTSSVEFSFNDTMYQQTDGVLRNDRVA